MQRVILVDGEPVEAGTPAIAADDPGLYGMGVYESLRTYGGRPFAVARHLERLANGARMLGIAADIAATETEIGEAAGAALASGAPRELTIRIIVTATGRRVIDAGPLNVRPATVAAVTLPWRRATGGPLEGIKATSLAATLVARRHVQGLGIDDGLWLTTGGRVSEAIAANVFAVLGGRLVTPPLEDGPLAGVTRGLLLELGAEQRSLPLAALLAADEAFLSATSAPARALISVDGRTIGDGLPGHVTRRIADRFATEAQALLDQAATTS